jgi:hypothetical protein
VVRRWVIGGAAAAIAVAAVTVYLRFRTDDTVTPVGVADAVAEFQGDSSPSTVDEAHATVHPAPGVYRYTTVGGDRIDALGGASHDYPAVTTIVVRATGCGVTQRWIGAVERFDEVLSCVDDDGAVATRAYTEFHRFFGTDDRQDYRCDGAGRPLGAPAGTTWTFTCRRDGETGVWTGEALGAGELTVAGRTVAVKHVAWSVDNGDPRDQQRTETWYLAGTDLVVRRVMDTATVEESVVGTVHYTEHLELTLDSLTPTR